MLVIISLQDLQAFEKELCYPSMLLSDAVSFGNVSVVVTIPDESSGNKHNLHHKASIGIVVLAHNALNYSKLNMIKLQKFFRWTKGKFIRFHLLHILYIYI